MFVGTVLLDAYDKVTPSIKKTNALS
nr:hypothetical protein LRH_08868 [Lacticaseibacillus rhamnosus HN001]